MTPRIYTVYENAGYAWLEVGLCELHMLNILGSISPYIYVNGSLAYLEKELDMTTFLNAITKTGIGYELVTVTKVPPWMADTPLNTTED